MTVDVDHNSGLVDEHSRVCKAQYSVAENDMWAGNPLIEALPHLFTNDEFMDATCYLPPFQDRMREDPDHIRSTYIQRVLRFFMPSRQHLILQQRFARVLRDGYVDRNPLADLGWSRLHGQVERLAGAAKYGVAPHEPPSTLGFAIIGTAGVGKTTAMDAVLRTYPKAIVHHSYADEHGKCYRLMRTQIVAIKLNCPEDGTLKSLCLSFFHEVDRITGNTTFLKECAWKGTKQRSATEMLPDMARVASLLSLGALVIDEIQFLSKQRSGGRQQMLQWFTRLTNEIKLPVILIGTPKAKEVLDEAFWQRRRNAGQGELHWNRMAQDAEWDTFIRALWRYEFVRNPTELVEGKFVPQDLSDALYEESQGIADPAVRMFMIAQENAINSQEERLTPDLIEWTARNDFSQLREVLQAIKNDEPAVHAEVDDVILKLARPTADGDARVERAQVLRIESAQAGPKKRLARPTSDPAGPPLLPRLAREARERREKVPQALRDAGYAVCPTEFGL